MVNPGHRSRACDSCRKLKSKCNEEKPSCSRCSKAGKKCIYSVAERSFRNMNAWSEDKVQARVYAKQQQRRSSPGECCHRLTLVPSACADFCSYDTPDMVNVAQWCHHISDGVPACYRAGQRYWIDTFWNMARSSEMWFLCLSLYAFRKESMLSGTWQNKKFLAQRGRLLHKLQSRLNGCERKVDPMALAATTTLASFDLAEGNLGFTQLHLQLLQRLDALRLVDNRLWFFVAWFDLKYAAFVVNHPMLPYYIPDNLRMSTLSRDNEDQYQTRAAMMVRCSPAHEAVGHTFLYDLFHSLLRAIDGLAEASEVPPLGFIYDIEYRIRTVRAQMRTHDPGLAQSSSQCLELIITTVQLVIIIAARQWIPTRHEARLEMLTSVSSLLETHGNNMTSFWRQNAAIPSLLWIITTCGAMAVDENTAEMQTFLSILHDVLEHIGTSTKAQLFHHLHEWPWVENWHPKKCAMLWNVFQSEDYTVRCDRREARSGFAGCTTLFIGTAEVYAT